MTKEALEVRMARFEERQISQGEILKQIQEHLKKESEGRTKRYTDHVANCENKYVFRREVRVGWVLIGSILSLFGFKLWN